MHSVSLYIQLGIDHIADLAGLDHILFLIEIRDAMKSNLTTEQKKAENETLRKLPLEDK